MRNITLILLFSFICLIAKTQDLLVLKEGRKIQCKITKIDSLNIYFNLIFKEKEISTSIDKYSVQDIIYNDTGQVSSRKKVEFSFSKNTFFEAGLGGTYLIDKATYSQLGWGVAGGLRYRFDIPETRIGIAPIGNFRFYSANVEGAQDWSDKLWIFNVGIQISVQVLPKNNDFKLLTFVELTNSWVDNFFSNSNNNYNNNSNTYQVDVSNPDISIFSGSSLSSKLGCRLYYSKIYFEFSYDILNAQVDLSDELKSFFQKENISYNSSFQLPMNAFNITLGFSLNPKVNN